MNCKQVVYVGLVSPAHLALVKLLLEAGKAVVCEKPLGLSLAEVTFYIVGPDLNSAWGGRWRRWWSSPGPGRSSCWRQSGAGDLTTLPCSDIIVEDVSRLPRPAAPARDSRSSSQHRHDVWPGKTRTELLCSGEHSAAMRTRGSDWRGRGLAAAPSWTGGSTVSRYSHHTAVQCMQLTPSQLALAVFGSEEPERVVASGLLNPAESVDTALR